MTVDLTLKIKMLRAEFFRILKREGPRGGRGERDRPKVRLVPAKSSINSNAIDVLAFSYEIAWSIREMHHELARKEPSRP